MKRSVTKLLTISLVVISLMSFVKPEKWFWLVSEEYGYKIEFPEEPVERPKVVNSEIGELKLNVFLYDASLRGKDDNLVYMVNYTEYPVDQIHSNNTEILPDLFRNSVEGVVMNVNGELLSEEEIQLGQYPGREIRIDYKNGMAIISMRIYLVENKMYMIQTITETKKEAKKSIDRFMDSFELIGAGTN